MNRVSAESVAIYEMFEYKTKDAFKVILSSCWGHFKLALGPL